MIVIVTAIAIVAAIVAEMREPPIATFAMVAGTKEAESGTEAEIEMRAETETETETETASGTEAETETGNEMVKESADMSVVLRTIVAIDFCFVCPRILCQQNDE